MKHEAFKLKRRSFLKLAVGTGLAAAGFSIPRFVRAEGIVEESEKTVNTFCGVCSGGCAMKGYVKDGRLIHLAGNPDDLASGNPLDPADGGRICVKAHSAIRTLYDPDRLKYPMKRTNPEKGIGIDPGFVQISWDEAIETVAQRFNDLIGKYGPETLMFIVRGNDYTNRLGKVIGTPNLISHNSTCYVTQEAVWEAMVTGKGRPWTYDMENCRYILSMGWDGLGKAKNMQMRTTAKALAAGARLVVLDPYHSVTASKAHEWLPIKPGTDLAFCLAMIHVIVREELYDKEFVEAYTSGFEYLEEFSRNYTPQWASEITGIPAETITRIAREFATTKPAHIPSHKRDAAGPNYANSYRVAQAQIILNSLVGTIDRPGGTILPRKPKFPAFDDVFPIPEDLPIPEARKERIDGAHIFKPTASKNKGNFATLAEGILNENPYPAKAALVRSYNTLSFPNSRKIVKAFAALEFMVCFEIYPSEMAQLADIVLPEPHWLESSGLGTRDYHNIYPQVAVRLPVVEPLYEETKGFGGVVVSIAKAMGLGDYFEGVSGSKFNDECMKAVGSSWEELAASPNGLWEDRKPFKGKEEFGTPSGKIELYATVFEEAGYDPLPYWKPKREAPSEEYPFYFLISRPPMHKMTQTQNNTLAMELFPENSATMNVETGRSLGIKDGDAVYVESRAGKIRLKAKLIAGIRPDCVQVMHGFGHWSKDLSVANGRGGSDGDLIPDMTFEEMAALKDPGAGGCMSDFCVKVYKA